MEDTEKSSSTTFATPTPKEDTVVVGDSSTMQLQAVDSAVSFDSNGGSATTMNGRPSPAEGGGLMRATSDDSATTTPQQPPPTNNKQQLTDSALSAASSTASSPTHKPATRRTSTAEAGSDDCVKVAVRIRPLLPLERQEPCLTILDDVPTASDDDEAVATSVRVGARRSGMTYTFDCVYGAHTTQSRLYQHSVIPLLHACLQGYNATILAYGQTGSGKTHTILGNHVTGDLQGVLPRTIHALFDALSMSAETAEENGEEAQTPENVTAPEDGEEQPQQPANNNNDASLDRPCDDWKVQVQFLEIYGEDIRDLLRTSGEDAGSTANKVTIRDGVLLEEPEVLGVVQPRVYSAAEALQSLQTGRLRRVTAATAMNATSSRSHALFTILVEQQWKAGDNGSTAATAATATVTRRSKFHFVDLAGSERAKRTKAEGQRLKEGIEINKGLLVLGNVIAALASSSSAKKPVFVPYRDSKLTRLLRGSLGGNHKTLMIACVSPSADNMEESLNCLRYANRAKQIQNKAVINLDPTSQYILTLQQHITKLAQQALFHYNLSSTSTDVQTRESAAAKEGSAYTQDQLRALSVGESMESVLAGIQAPEGVTVPSTPGQRAGAFSLATPSPSRTPQHAAKPAAAAAVPLLDEDPAVVAGPKDAAEENLYWQKAQSSMHQLFQGSSSTTPVNKDADPMLLQMNGSGASTDDANTVRDMTMQKMVEYEREIGTLKKALAVERSQRAMIQEEQSWMDQVQQSLQDDRNRLEHLQHSVEEDDEESGPERMEAEEHAEQEAVKSWTKKYADDGGDDGDVEDNDEDNESAHSQQGPDDDDDEAPSPETLTQSPPAKHRKIQEDLMELSRSIAAKEELIGQLKASQERYEQMREFYEAKLKEMESSLIDKEEEREALVKKLDEAQKSKASVIKSQELREKLREKEAHIATLKKKSVELRKLTTVSSRNANEINRLTRDVGDMKRRKVELQKRLTEERKNHANQIKRYQKEAMQKERELTKYKRLTTKREIEAEKANQIAKTRLAELGALRAKYKDTEQKLRLQSVKRGVMAKAGLDPVLVGHRDKGKHNIDTNALRDLFDEKVSKVARKEALVNKLAEEWEQHFQLSSQRDEVAKQAESTPEDLENIEMQLKYKEDRIRNLAKRLEKEGSADEALAKDTSGRPDSKESFLFDAQFERVCKSAPPDVAHKSLAKVLFGMVVRERRRVAALARTACSLDERLQAAAEESEGKELALRTYKEEQRAQVAEMTQNHQSQILSLMELVKDDATSEEKEAPADDAFDETLLVLANERITALEQQLENSALEAEAAKAHRAELDKTKEELQQSRERNQSLDEELHRVSEELRTVKGMLSKMSMRGVELPGVMAAVDRALAPEAGDEVKGTNTISAPSQKSNQLPAALKELEIDESEAEAEEPNASEPEWANEIMEDLALIAEGKVPPSLKGTPGYEDKQQEPAKPEAATPENPPSRLASPRDFSAALKQAQQRQSQRNKSRAKSRSDSADEADKQTPTAAAGRQQPRNASRARSRSSREQGRPAPVRGSSAERSGRTPRHSQIPRREDSGSQQKEDVFERLSNQTTFAFSIRQNGAPDDGEEEQHPPPRLTSVDALLDEVLGQSHYNGHNSPDVFERLTKTTTEAYAMKVNRGKDGA